MMRSTRRCCFTTSVKGVSLPRREQGKQVGWLLLGGLVGGSILQMANRVSHQDGRLGGSVCYAAEVPIVVTGGGGDRGNKGKGTAATKPTTGQPPTNDGLCSLVHQDKLTQESLEKIADKLAGGSSTPEGSLEESYAKYDRLRSYVNTLGHEGLSPLMVAAGLGKVEAVAALLHYGASVSQPCACSASTYLAHIFTSFRRGMSPLEFGIASGNKEVVTLLFAHQPLDGTSSTSGGANQSSSSIDPLNIIEADGDQQQSGGNPSSSYSSALLDPYKEFARSFWYDDKAKATAVISAIEEGAALQRETARLQRLRYPLESRLRTRIVGQYNAIQVVSNAVRRKENGWFDSESPLVMMFMGSSGIGKTETAKTVATYLFGESILAGRDGTTIRNGMPSSGQGGGKGGGPAAQIAMPPPPYSGGSNGKNNKAAPNPEDCFIRIDMSEYQSKHEVSKFIGSPPGYVGHEQGGQLTDKLEKCPNAVVLLDEVEKAHPDVLSIMLQVFDEGRLTSGKGDTILCKDAIFVMTSNLAQREIADEAERIRAMASGKDVRRREQLLDETVSGKGLKKGMSSASKPAPTLTSAQSHSDSTAADSSNTIASDVNPQQQRQVSHRRDGTTVTTTQVIDKAVVGSGAGKSHIHYSVPSPTDGATSSYFPLSGSSSKSPLSDDFTRTVVHRILRSHFGRDELIGRINEIVYFLPFSEDERKQLAAMELRKWAARAKVKNGVELTWTDSAVERAVRGYNVRYGARSIKYEIDRLLIGAVARAHEEGAITRGSKVKMDVTKAGTWWRVGSGPVSGEDGGAGERVVLDIERCDDAVLQEERARRLMGSGGGSGGGQSSSSWKGWFGGSSSK